MRLHTELFPLRQLLLEKLEGTGYFLFRDLNQVEVDLSGGELILFFNKEKDCLEVIPVLVQFCNANEMEVKSWDGDEKVCHLGFGLQSPPTPNWRPRSLQLPATDKDQKRLQRTYTAAVTQVFNAPESGGALLHAGRVAWAMGRSDFALIWFERAARSSLAPPALIESLLWAGICNHLDAITGDRVSLARACRYYRKVLSLEGSNFFALLNLGKLCLLLSRRRWARRWLRRALRNNPGDGEAAMLLQRLDGE